MSTDKTPTNATIDALYDRTVVDQSGNKIGEIGQVYLDDASGQPAWVTVKTGLFGRNETFVPFKGLETSGGQIRTIYTKDKVKDAPNVDPDGHLSEDETEELYRYYSDAFASGKTTGKTETTDKNVNQGGRVAAGGAGGNQVADNKTVSDTKDHGTDHKSPVAGDGSVVRHEERLNVGKERVETGRVRIHKHIVHDTETVEVPVEREEIHVERVPLDEKVAADDVKLSEGTHDIVTHEERPVVNKETVGVEKIRINKEAVQDTETVSDKVAKEQIDIDNAKRTK
ncbi:DUF2382 domain-containing protein [Cutibacterium sp. WCA-380-WT-3A]|uniref:DUF2382 domain-containing protein n=1 Tax=Cutibacterium porci TaxID=2605781 RepID=A0A7K0J3L0_9ACTN|nr:PRC and DUF2382 domain-containing protein [Cutibacterium porci]MSS44515.1 DUF2382 domain-containing protein [Cutibacterium porci]